MTGGGMRRSTDYMFTEGTGKSVYELGLASSAA